MGKHDEIEQFVRSLDDWGAEFVLDKALQKYALHVLPFQSNKELTRKQLEELILTVLDIALIKCSCNGLIESKNEKGESYYEYVMREEGKCDIDKICSAENDAKRGAIRDYPIIRLVEGGI